MITRYAKIAGFNVRVDSLFEIADFETPLTDDIVPDITISVSGKDIDDFRCRFNPNTSKFSCAWGIVLEKLSEWLPSQNAFLLHSATFDIDGVGVAFSARSGTGKTTHMLLWQQLLGNRLTVVNGDKPIVRFFDDEPNIPFAYGTPWSGKERFGSDMRTPLKHICFIERSETNYVTKLEKADAVNLIIKQVYLPRDPIAVGNTMCLVDKLLSICDLWTIHCNMELNAAKIAYESIFA